MESTWLVVSAITKRWNCGTFFLCICYIFYVFFFFKSKLVNLFKAEINYMGYILSLITFSGKLSLPKFSSVSNWLHDTWYCPLPLSPTIVYGAIIKHPIWRLGNILNLYNFEKCMWQSYFSERTLRPRRNHLTNGSKKS